MHKNFCLCLFRKWYTHRCATIFIPFAPPNPPNFEGESIQDKQYRQDLLFHPPNSPKFEGEYTPFPASIRRVRYAKANVP